jgi:hypothetical protein
LLENIKGQRRAKKKVLKVLRELYDSITVFHATRTANVQRFYAEGLQIADHRKLAERAREIFLSGEFPEIDEAIFQSAVASLSNSDDALVHVGLDDRPLIESSGHYLIYGSEHICGIAASLTRHFGCATDYRQVLKRFGRPTILRVSLPISIVAEWNLLAFAEIVRDSMKKVEAGREAPKADFTFIIKAPISPRCVLGHEHPTVIKDPLLPMQPLYYFREVS